MAFYLTVFSPGCVVKEQMSPYYRTLLSRPNINYSSNFTCFTALQTDFFDGSIILDFMSIIMHIFLLIRCCCIFHKKTGAGILCIECGIIF